MPLPGQGLLNTIAGGGTLLGGNSFFANITYGWWVFIGCVGAVLLAGTPLAPGVLGVMTIASIFQAEKLVTHQ